MLNLLVNKFWITYSRLDTDKVLIIFHPYISFIFRGNNIKSRDPVFRAIFTACLRIGFGCAVRSVSVFLLHVSYLVNDSYTCFDI